MRASMTIWALALLASFSHATVVPVRGSARPTPVAVVPAVAPILGGGAGAGVSIGNLDLRGALSLPTPVPGLTGGLPASPFVPPGALQFKKFDAQAAAAPLSAPDAAPQKQAESGALRPANGILPEEPVSGVTRLGALPARSAGDTATRSGLVPALGASAADNAPSAPIGEEAAVSAGRGLFDNATARAAVDVSRFAAPTPPAPAARSALRPHDDGAQKAWFRALAGPDADADAARVPLTGYAPDAAPVAVRPPLPGAAGDVALRDAVASLRPSLADPLAAGLRGGHAPLLARPSRLTLAGEGLVVRVAPAPGADALLRGRPSWTAPAASARRLVSTEIIERGALLEAVSAADAAIGRGLLGMLDNDIPGAMAGSLRPKLDARHVAGEVASPARRAPATSPSWLLLSVLPLAAFAAARRFL